MTDPVEANNCAGTVEGADGKAASIRNLSLSQIVGLHSELERLYGELSIPPLRQVPTRAILREDIEDLLSVLPICVSQEKGRLRCTGNIRIIFSIGHSGDTPT
ncbi:MAG: hypothetical protein D4R84_18075 [Rhodocyclaceae bacterium]|nr:MAG: hypothetical protein D4R84_18075 [Rhodocyclaceae bacterium]